MFPNPQNFQSANGSWGVVTTFKLIIEGKHVTGLMRKLKMRWQSATSGVGTYNQQCYTNNQWHTEVKSKMHIGIESSKPCPQIMLVSPFKICLDTAKLTKSVTFQSWGMWCRKSLTDTLSNKYLHQLKQQCEGTKKRKSLMYYTLWAARWKKYTYYTWPHNHSSRRRSWRGIQLKVCLKCARIPLQLHHNAQRDTEGIVADRRRLFQDVSLTSTNNIQLNM